MDISRCPNLCRPNIHHVQKKKSLEPRRAKSPLELHAAHKAQQCSPPQQPTVHPTAHRLSPSLETARSSRSEASGDRERATRPTAALSNPSKDSKSSGRFRRLRFRIEP
jgi:hypothetical protein